MGRNLCDDCKECEDNDKSITYCFDVCGVPIDILHDIERERNAKKSEDKGMENKGIAIAYCINIPVGSTNSQTFIDVFGIDVWKQMIEFSNLNEQFKEFWEAPYKESEDK